jgi:hypothetical protein
MSYNQLECVMIAILVSSESEMHLPMIRIEFPLNAQTKVYPANRGEGEESENLLMLLELELR